MRKCNSCTVFVKHGFYCSDCYYRYLGSIIVSDKDFETYINRSFGTNYKIAGFISYRDIYNHIALRESSIYSLRSILKNIIYLKSLGLI